MILVDYDENKQKEDRLTTYDEIDDKKSALKEILMQMDKVLNDDSLTDKEKIMIHSKLLQRYIFLRSEEKKEMGNSADMVLKMLQNAQPKQFETSTVEPLKKKYKPLKQTKLSFPASTPVESPSKRKRIRIPFDSHYEISLEPETTLFSSNDISKDETSGSFNPFTNQIESQSNTPSSSSSMTRKNSGRRSNKSETSAKNKKKLIQSDICSWVHLPK